MTKNSTMLHVKHFLECLSPAQNSLLTSRLRNPLLAVPPIRARTQGWRLLLLLAVVQLLSCFQLFASPWTVAGQASLSFTVSQNVLKLMSIELVMPSNHLILCQPLLLLQPSIFPSIRVFSNELALGIMWPKYWSFSFSISPSNEYSGLISFRIEWLDLLAVQGTLRVFSSITVQKHQFFSTQPSLWSNSHICTWLLEKPYHWLYGPLLAKWCPCFLLHCLGLS